MISRLTLGSVRLLFARLLLNIDSELLRSLARTAAIKAECDSLRDVVIATLKLNQNQLMLEVLHPLRQDSRVNIILAEGSRTGSLAARSPTCNACCIRECSSSARHRGEMIGLRDTDNWS